MNDYKYYAFISYKREDEEWAVWLQHELEYYHLPAVLNGREDLPKEFRPVFRDIDELKAGNLPNQIHEALASSANLLVICSPRSANSIWVNKEIEDFIEIGKSRGTNNLERVFPFIVDGTPHAKDESQECFPKALRDLPANQERIGGNVNESGRDKAFIKIMAGMLPNVSLDMLWNRYERDKAEEERRKREERDRLLALQSRFVAEKAQEVMHEVYPYDKGKAACMALEVLPTDLVNPERPLVPEAELVLREAMFEYSTIAEIEKIERKARIVGINEKFVAYYGITGSVDINIHRYSDTIWIHEISTGKKLYEFKGIAYKGCLSSNGLIFAYSDADGLFGIRDVLSGTCITPIDVKINNPSHPHTIAFSPDGSLLAIGKDGQSQENSIIGIWDTKSGECVNIIKGPTYKITSLKFDQNNQRIAASMHINSIIIWEISSGNNILTIKNQNNGYFKFADFITNTNSIVYIQCQSQSTTIGELKTDVFFDTLYVYDFDSKKQITTIDLADSTIDINNILFDNEYTIVDYGGGIDVYHSLNGNHIFHNNNTRSVIRQKEKSFLAITSSEIIIKFEFSALQEIILKAKEKYKDKALSEVEKKKYFITL